MRMFMVGEKFARYETTKERNAHYEEYKQEVRDKLGIEDGWLGGHEPYRIIEKDGFFYKNNPDWDELFRALAGESGKEEPPDGSAMCICGNKTFSIRYGDYSCLGQCLSCGKEHELYSG